MPCTRKQCNSKMALQKNYERYCNLREEENNRRRTEKSLSKSEEKSSREIEYANRLQNRIPKIETREKTPSERDVEYKRYDYEDEMTQRERDMEYKRYDYGDDKSRRERDAEYERHEYDEDNESASTERDCSDTSDDEFCHSDDDEENVDSTAKDERSSSDDEQDCTDRRKTATDKLIFPVVFQRRLQPTEGVEEAALNMADYRNPYGVHFPGPAFQSNVHRYAPYPTAPCLRPVEPIMPYPIDALYTVEPPATVPYPRPPIASGHNIQTPPQYGNNRQIQPRLPLYSHQDLGYPNFYPNPWYDYNYYGIHPSPYSNYPRDFYPY